MKKVYAYNYSLVETVHVQSDIPLNSFNTQISDNKIINKNRIIIKFDNFKKKKKLNKIGHNIFYDKSTVYIQIIILFFKLRISLTDLNKKRSIISMNKTYYFFSKFFFNNGILNSLYLDKIIFDIINYKLILNNCLPLHSGLSLSDRITNIYLGLAGSGKSILINKLINSRKEIVLSDDLIYLKKSRIYFINNYINLRRFSFLGIYDYLIPKIFTREKIKIKIFKKFININNKFIFYHLINGTKNKLNISNDKLIKKIDVIIKKNINFFNNRLLYSYLYMFPETIFSVEKIKKNLILNIIKKIKK